MEKLRGPYQIIACGQPGEDTCMSKTIGDVFGNVCYKCFPKYNSLYEILDTLTFQSHISFV
jgi:hypothetical protein